MVTMVPSFIMVFDDFSGPSPTSCARGSATVMVSGTETSRMTGSGVALSSASSCSSPPSSWRCFPLLGCLPSRAAGDVAAAQLERANDAQPLPETRWPRGLRDGLVFFRARFWRPACAGCLPSPSPLALASVAGRDRFSRLCCSGRFLGGLLHGPWRRLPRLTFSFFVLRVLACACFSWTSSCCLAASAAALRDSSSRAATSCAGDHR